MLVNFNTQYDTLSREVDQLKEILACKDDVIRGQAAELEKINQEYKNYRGLYSSDELSRLRSDLRIAKQRNEEVETNEEIDPNKRTKDNDYVLTYHNLAIF